jgi:hypothetical protein
LIGNAKTAMFLGFTAVVGIKEAREWRRTFLQNGRVQSFWMIKIRPDKMSVGRR